ncbi:SpaH/EbpB family LPXTG-anchored major pilin [Parafannyhessea umbonata]|uniref:SpaH/EbpB family LPXTG-anchored major pilin n=1 Tax=Parafannyhessea umbonata TaxID=604330 RepID=UPI0026E9BDD3|nr:SpaH/EbpB family LPXTG-anchored major pilin [Parafannyhessea umbonata]MCI6681812.1 SpaH/EbpB family LPXTG-anchored major pilin [Parafannyhessea umbonata]MCI7218275.1 SpaH/EbpB family LPXTG-anchored major pilin [Parafannyhessea umbonata]
MKHLSKMLKGLVAVFAAAAMALTLAPTAFAAEATSTTYKLTLTDTSTGHTYEAYQIFTGDLSKKEDGTKVLSNVKWGTGVTYTGSESAADVAKALGDGSMTIAQLEEKLTLTKPVKTVTSSEGSTVIDGLAAGYYLVKDQDGTQANKSDAYTKFIVQVVGNTEADIKSDVPTVEKKVKDTNDSTGETSGWQDSADADINDWVPYQITGTMPDNIADYTSYKYVFTDTMSKGLTYDKDDAGHKAVIKIGDKDVTSSFTEDVTTDKDGRTVVTWTCDNLKGIDGVTLDENTTVVVTYSAKLNENAVIGANGNPNTVNLTYSNNPNKGGEGETGKTPEDKNIVFTYKTVVNKLDQDKKSLAGAAFKLEKKQSDGKYKTVKEFTAGEETKFEFKGLDDGTYKLTETTTPAGYNTIDPIEFTISAEHDEASDDPKLTDLSGDVKSGEAKFTADTNTGSLTTDVVNKKGSTLPSTGGMGTTVLYVAGAVIVVAAGIGLALRRNKRQDA